MKMSSKVVFPEQPLQAWKSQEPGDGEIMTEDSEEGETALCCSQKPCTHRIVTSPEFSLVMFDILFFSTYIVGWLLTFLFNPKAITDNAVVKIFRNYNICIGVDTYPARYAAIPMSYLFTLAYMWTCILFFKRMLDQPGEHKQSSKYF